MVRRVIALAALFAAAPSFAAANTASGTVGGVSWTASSYIVGQTSTGTIATGGNPIYTAPYPAFSGVVGLLMDYGSAGAFVCSGTLLSDRRSIATAGHCVSDGFGSAAPLTTTAFFRSPGSNPDTYVYPSGGVVDPTVDTRAVSAYFVNPGYTGEVIDQNDIAILRLADLAPAYALSYEIYNGGDLTGQNFNVAGYGTRSPVGGAQGTTGTGAGAGVGRLRQGNNTYDFAWGDAAFDGLFTNYDPECNNPPGSDPDGGTNWFCGAADIEFSFISDFDNGLAANDASCIVSQQIGGVSDTRFCSTGLGALEVSIAGGDSGGPGFIDGRLASINSYGLTFGSAFGDFKCPTNNNCLQSSWGEFNGFVPTYIHADFITGAMNAVPEPASWAMMISGFGLIGVGLRTRKRTAIAAA